MVAKAGTASRMLRCIHCDATRSEGCGILCRACYLDRRELRRCQQAVYGGKENNRALALTLAPGADSQLNRDRENG
jgi:hypothetical protein